MRWLMLSSPLLFETRGHHLPSEEGDLGLQWQLLGTEIVAGEQGHAPEHPLVVSDQLVVGGVLARVARVAPEARDPVEPDRADEVLSHARGPARGHAAAALDAAIEQV